jgi:hypothetical protein
MLLAVKQRFRRIILLLGVDLVYECLYVRNYLIQKALKRLLNNRPTRIDLGVNNLRVYLL